MISALREDHVGRRREFVEFRTEMSGFRDEVSRQFGTVRSGLAQMITLIDRPTSE